MSGALDPVSLRAANALVGNAPGAGALEVAYVGPTLAIEADSVRLAFVGAKAAIEILPDETASAGTLIGTMESIHLRRGDVVRIGSLREATTLYVAVEGGFDIAPVLGSVSTYMRGGIGGWQGRALAASDRLPLERLRRATPVLRAEDDVYTNHIHADDLAAMLVTALTHPAAEGIYNACDDSANAMGDWFDLVADRTGIPRPPRISRTEAAHRIPAPLLSFMSESRRLVNKRIKEQLGVKLRFPTVFDGVPMQIAQRAR